MPTDTYIVTLTDTPNPHETRPAEVRLRAVLKLLLRGYGLRCVAIRPAEPDVEPHGDSQNCSSETVS